MKDASLRPELNGIRILDQLHADKIKVPVGEVVPWAVCFPRP